MVVVLSPARGHIFNVRYEKDRRLLSKDRDRAFHKSVESLMFVTTICRCEIKTVLELLCKRVLHTDDYDGGKLKRLLKHIRGKFI